jgi:hypothetical protein
MRSSDGLSRSVAIAIGHHSASQTQQVRPAPAQNLLNRRSITRSSRVVFYVSPTWPTSRSIALAAMKETCGAKRAGSSMRSMPWIAANRKKGDGAPVSVIGENCQPPMFDDG